MPRDLTPASSSRNGTGPWWILLVTGSAWLLSSLVVLQLGLADVGAISVLFGVILLAAGLNEFLVAVRGRRRAPLALGVLLLAAAVLTWAWPDPTFATLARLVGWYLLVRGAADIVWSLVARHVAELWWLRLVGGGAQVALAFWAVGYTGRSTALLVLWVGLAALLRGLTEIGRAFDARPVAVTDPPEPTPPPATTAAPAPAPALTSVEDTGTEHARPRRSAPVRRLTSHSALDQPRFLPASRMPAVSGPVGDTGPDTDR